MEHGTYNNEDNFHKKLESKMDNLVHLVYGISKNFPKDELYGVTSQLRRAALSVVLNYIEGFSRIKTLVYINFLEISYGSLKECKYLIRFCFEEQYLNERQNKELSELVEEIGAMLWTTMRGLKNK